jgi:hypothetical protein
VERDGASHPRPLFPIQSERKVQSYVSAQNTLGTPEGRSVVHRRAIEQMKRQVKPMIVCAASFFCSHQHAVTGRMIFSYLVLSNPTLKSVQLAPVIILK